MNDSKDTSTQSPLTYKGPVSGLKGLLTNKLAQGVASVVSAIDSFSDEAPSTVEEAGTNSIPIEKIYPCPDQPRQIFEPKALEDLSATMRELGQAQAITVRKTDRGYEIISGERRYRAAKLAGLSHLDCVVKDCSPKEARLFALVENTQRQDLLPLEEAFYLKKVLQEQPELSLEKLAKMLGSHKSTLSEKIQLTEVPEDLQPVLFAKGRSFTHRHWRVISRISDPVFLRDMLKNCLENQMSVGELERALEAAGIKKATRKKSLDLSAESTSKQLSLENLGVIQREGRNVRIRAMTIDLDRLSPEFRTQMIGDLEALIHELKTPL